MTDTTDLEAELRAEGQSWREQVGEMPLFDRAADALAYARTENAELRGIVQRALDVRVILARKNVEARADLAEANRKIEEALAELSDYTFAGLGNALAILSTGPKPTEGNTDV